jgi:hypothetical protein
VWLAGRQRGGSILGWISSRQNEGIGQNGTYSLKVDSTGKCLDADSGEDHLNGGTVQLWSCHFGSNQSWRLERRNTEEF